MGLDRLNPRWRWVWVCSCLSRGDTPSAPGLEEVLEVLEVVGERVGGVTAPREATFLALSSVSWVRDTKVWAVLLRAAREEPKEVAEVGGTPGWGPMGDM